MQVTCQVLPVGRRVCVRVAAPHVSLVCCALHQQLRLLHSSTITLLTRDSSTGALTPLRGDHVASALQAPASSVVYALVRCRGGGKGGFRKQLEKKAREFARAKRTEQRQDQQQQQQQRQAARKAAAATTKPQHAAVPTHASATTQDSVSAELLRALVQQGVDHVVARVTARQHASTLSQQQTSHGDAASCSITQTAAYTYDVCTARGTQTVTLGVRHACTCRGKEQPCVHVLRVLTQCCGLGADDALVWQAGMTELELLTYAQRDGEVVAAIAAARTRAPLTTSTPVVPRACVLCRERTHERCGHCDTPLHRVCASLVARLRRDACVTCPRCGVTCSAGTARTRMHAQATTTRAQHSSTTAADAVTAIQLRELVPEDYAALLSLDADVPARDVLSLDAFARLPQLTHDGSSPQALCGVCTEALCAGQACVRLPCAHVLHRACAQRWLVHYCARCPFDYKHVHE